MGWQTIIFLGKPDFQSLAILYGENCRNHGCKEKLSYTPLIRIQLATGKEACQQAIDGLKQMFWTLPASLPEGSVNDFFLGMIELLLHFCRPTEGHSLSAS